jgi:hypothetical protein
MYLLRRFVLRLNFLTLSWKRYVSAPHDVEAEVRFKPS